MNPRDYGLEHDSWYPGQIESIQWAIDPGNSGKARILESPTGTGKTGIARAVSSKYDRTIAIVRTKFLQSENYEPYGFSTLFGKSNYPCVHPEADEYTTANECLFAEIGMSRCPVVHKCGYVVARQEAMTSNRAVLNYAYWFHVKNKWPDPDLFVLDEAHQIPDLVLDWSGIRISESARRSFGLPIFPVMNGVKNDVGRAIQWMKLAREVLAKEYVSLCTKLPLSSEKRKKASAIERAGKKIKATMESLERCEFGWFIRSGPKALDGKPGIVVRPLTARYHAPYFFNFQRSLIMSATIGDFNTFAGELGISDFVSRRNKNPWPPEHRPIYDLGAPRIGRKSTPADYEEQAKLIANAIAQCDESWPGLIHVTSIEEAERLYYRLKTSGKAGLNYRVFLCPRASTNEAVEAWKERKKVVPNSIMVSWMLWEGYDGVDEKINIVAKVPYPNIGDLYERERMRFDGKFFLQRTAWQFIQGLGRTRRSAEDYDVSGQNGFVAIADGNWTRIRKYIPESILESIVKL